MQIPFLLRLVYSLHNAKIKPKKCPVNHVAPHSHCIMLKCRLSFLFILWIAHGLFEQLKEVGSGYHVKII